MPLEVISAAGRGARSALGGGRPELSLPIRAAQECGIGRDVVDAGHGPVQFLEGKRKCFINGRTS